MENLEIDFIKSKGLLDEFKAYKKQREDAATGYKIFFEVMLGDGDGKYHDYLYLTKKIVEDFKKYFEAPEWDKNKEEMELIEVNHEFIPGGTVYVDQMEKLFNLVSKGDASGSIGTDNEHSLARLSFMVQNSDVKEWEKSEYYVEDSELEETCDTYSLADDIDEFFHDVYFRYVKPYVEEGKFERADCYGPYKLSAN